jgi:two-component system, response regulator PdtaR
MKQVLIVDDNRDLAANIAEILEAHGNILHVASDGDEALALLGAQPIDAVLTDMRMPRVSGPELLKEIRRRKPELPVMAFTAYSASAELAQAESLGLLAVLPKPVPVQRLLNLLNAARPSGIVLLVEDDESLRENVAEVLRQNGLTVINAASAEAIAEVGAVKPFAALVDLRLPDALEGEAVEQVRARFPEVPQVIITGHAELAPPTAQALLKPFDVRVLLARLEDLYRAQAAP